MDNSKLKAYLDTSVISYLNQTDVPEKMAETLQLWDKFKDNIFDVYISYLTINEIDGCDEEKRKILYKYLNEIKHNVLEVSKEAQELANQIIKLDILRPNSIDDATHIGVAILNKCDYIISWNFKHLVNIKTVNGVRAITSLNGLSDIGIVTPTFFLGEE